MKFIKKGREPSQLRDFKRKNRDLPELLRYDALDGDTKQALRQKMLKEQGYLCAYTMAGIARDDDNDCHIERIRPQSENEANELDYSNLLMCAGSGQDREDSEWGAGSKRNASVHESNFVSPLNPDCEHRLRYGTSGRVAPVSEADKAARRTIDLLALNHRFLIDARRLSLRLQGLGPDARRPLSAAQAERLAQGILRPDRGGHFSPYCVAIKQVAEMYALKIRKLAARLKHEADT